MGLYKADFTQNMSSLPFVSKNWQEIDRNKKKE